MDSNIRLIFQKFGVARSPEKQVKVGIYGDKSQIDSLELQKFINVKSVEFRGAPNLTLLVMRGTY